MKDVSVTSLKNYDRFSEDKLSAEGKWGSKWFQICCIPLENWLLSVSKIKVRITCPSSASLPLLPSSRIFSFSPFLHSFTHRGRQKPFHFTSTGGPPFVKPDSTHTHTLSHRWWMQYQEAVRVSVHSDSWQTCVRIPLTEVLELLGGCFLKVHHSRARPLQRTHWLKDCCVLSFEQNAVISMFIYMVTAWYSAGAPGMVRRLEALAVLILRLRRRSKSSREDLMIKLGIWVIKEKTIVRWIVHFGPRIPFVWCLEILTYFFSC